MDVLARFRAYAEDFERTYVDDDWTRIAPYFAEDAAYRVEGMPLFPIDARGRQAVLDALKQALDGFDRNCQRRELALDRPPAVDGSTVTIDWHGTYGIDGCEDLTFEGVETLRYNDAGEIVEMVDSYPQAVADRVAAWMATHRDRLRR